MLRSGIPARSLQDASARHTLRPTQPTGKTNYRPFITFDYLSGQGIFLARCGRVVHCTGLGDQ